MNLTLQRLNRQFCRETQSACLSAAHKQADEGTERRRREEWAVKPKPAVAQVCGRRGRARRRRRTCQSSEKNLSGSTFVSFHVLSPKLSINK